jgi:lipopolysaccharide transport system ATP-binding protein
MPLAIKIENLSKAYQLGEIGTGTLSRDLERWWARMRGKEDPFLRIGESNDRTVVGTSDVVWSLRDINLEVNQGDALGIIGRNGAGKSTLLKILSRVTAPTTGTLKARGRIASLLEVGTGFHPELTGRENIFLNGAILGMRKAEIRRKFDEIVEFAGVQRYIDTPVKRYSSGMYVRLAFAVAAHLESEILIVDEVLAVGDAEFQKRCLGKMKDVSRGEGRTVLFVSHNMTAVKSLCNSGVLLDRGRIATIGGIEQVVYDYSSQVSNSLQSFVEVENETNGITVRSIKISDSGLPGVFNIEDDLRIDIAITASNPQNVINVNLFFKATDDAVIFVTHSKVETIEPGNWVFNCIIPARTLNDITYSIDLMVVQNAHDIIHSVKDVMRIEGVEGRRDGAWMGKFPGLLRPGYYKWTVSQLN